MRWPRTRSYDRGAERMLAQTRLLAAAFRGYEGRVAQAGACDEHSLREHLLAHPAQRPVREIVVTVGDWIADPNGLYVADFDLLTRLPKLEAIDIVATEGLLGSGFHQRIHEWLPGIEEVEAARIGLVSAPSPRPVLEVPDDGTDALVFARRDREEELIALARDVRAAPLARPRRRRLQAPVALPVSRARGIRERPHPVSGVRRVAARGGADRRCC